jgi:hypothetical protein
MHAAWEKASGKPRYSSFEQALNAGMQKLDEYYQRSAASDAHIMAMGKYLNTFHLCTDLSDLMQSSTPGRRWAILCATGLQTSLKTLKMLSARG